MRYPFRWQKENLTEFSGLLILVVITAAAMKGCQPQKQLFTSQGPLRSQQRMMPINEKVAEMNHFSPKEAEKLLQRIVDITPTRSHDNIQSLDACADLIDGELKQYGYQTSRQKYGIPGHPSSTDKSLEYQNVSAFYGDPDLPRLIIGAHYDVHTEHGENYQGADDNGSAVVGGLLLAKAFAREKPELPYSIEFVFYTLEEPPYFGTENMGSYIHAKSLADKKIPILGMVCLEMIGYFTDQPKTQNYPLTAMKLTYPTTGNFIAIVSNFDSVKLMRHYFKTFDSGNVTKLPAEKLAAPSFLTGVDFSDHRNYWRFKYPAIMVTDTSFFRNPHYHTNGDTIDTIDFPRLCEVCKGVYAASISLDMKKFKPVTPTTKKEPEDQ